MKIELDINDVLGTILRTHARNIEKSESDVIEYALRQYFMGMSIKTTIKQLKTEFDRIKAKLDGILIYEEKEDCVKIEENKEEVSVPDIGIEPNEGDRAYVKGEMFIYLGGEWKNTRDLPDRKCVK